MIETLKTAVGGMNSAATRVAQSAQVIVNASSTNASTPSNDMTSALVAIKSDSVAYGANAAVVKIAAKMQRTLIDMLA